MAFESNNFNVAKKYRLPKGEFSVECKIPTEGQISQIFTLSSDVMIGTKELLMGTVNYTGMIEACIVYLNEDGEVGSVHSSCPFSSKFESENILPDQKVVVRARIIDCSIGEITPSGVSVTYRLEQTGFVVGNAEVKSIMASGEEIDTRDEDMSVIRFVGENSCCLNSDIPLVTRDPIKKLLLCESQASVKDVETGLNFVSVTGEIVCRLLYLTESDKFESVYVFDNFKEEVELEGVTREATAEACAFVKYCEVKAVVDNEEKGAKVQINVPVDVCVFAYEKQSVNVVADLYSTSNELEIATESFEMTKNNPVEIIEGKIDGTLVIDDDKPRVDKVLFSGGNAVNITNVSIEEGVARIEGIAKTNVVYLNDETNSLNSVEVEVPFLVSERVDIKADSQIEAFATISDVDVVVKKGRELMYDAKLKIVLYSDSDEVSAVISEVAVKEEIAEKDCAMEIVFAKAGQSSWDIAKANKVKEAMLLSQNPGLVFPLQENAEIVLFYQNVKN